MGRRWLPIIGWALLLGSGTGAQAAEDGLLGFSGVAGFEPNKPIAMADGTHWISGGFATVPFESAATAHKVVFKNLDMGSGHTFSYNYEMLLSYDDGAIHQVGAKRSYDFPNPVSWGATAGQEITIYADLSGTRSLVEGQYTANSDSFLKSFGSNVETGDSQYVVFLVAEQ